MATVTPMTLDSVRGASGSMPGLAVSSRGAALICRVPEGTGVTGGDGPGRRRRGPYPGVEEDMPVLRFKCRYGLDAVGAMLGCKPAITKINRATLTLSYLGSSPWVVVLPGPPRHISYRGGHSASRANK